LVVGGSDHGRVYIFERKTGRVLKTLKYAKKGGVETIAVRDMENGMVLIASASATASSGPYAIVVWRWGSNQKCGDQEVVDGGWTTWKVIGFLIKLVVVIAAMMYFVELVRRTTENWTKIEEPLAGVESQPKVVAQKRSWMSREDI